MQRLVAALLRKRSAWQLVVIATVSTSIALWLIYSMARTTLRMMQPLLIVLFGLAGAALILALVRRSEDIGRAGDRPLTWWRFLAGIAGLAGLVAFTTYSLGHHRRHMVSGCNASLLPDTLDGRKQALAQAEAALYSPFALLPRLIDDAAGRECARSREDLDRAAQGLCTYWAIPGVACRCGDESYPYARCEAPNCLYKAGKPDRFDCPGDPIPPDERLD